MRHGVYFFMFIAWEREMKEVWIDRKIIFIKRYIYEKRLFKYIERKNLWRSAVRRKNNVKDVRTVLQDIIRLIF